MRFIKTVARLAAFAAVVGVAARWAAIQLRRIILESTDDSTPAIEPDQVAAKLRRVVVSDLHLGMGDQLDDFDADAELATFIRSYVTGKEPTELILAGDTFEFLQVRLPDLSDYEWSGEAATRRLEAIVAAHPEPIAALRDFVARPENQLTILIGNHDFELHYAAAKRWLCQALGLSEPDPQLRFGLTYSGGGMYIDHGMQSDPWNSFVHSEGVSKPFEVVRGTRMVKEVINPLEDAQVPNADVVDNVKPISAFFWYMLALPRLRQPEVRRFVVYGLLLLFRANALPRIYSWRPVPQPLASAGPDEAEVMVGRNRLVPAWLAQAFARWLQRKPPDTALAQIQQEARQQVKREVREFKDALIRDIASIASRPEHSDDTLFVCGHTHGTEIAELNEQQTYVNTGTWTEIVLDIATNRRQEQRYPFLEVYYSPDSAAPQWQLLVWQGSEKAPLPWVREDET